jgi:hypothetical protein
MVKVLLAESNRNLEDGTEHFAKLGAPEQLSDTAPRKPFSDETFKG